MLYAVILISAAIVPAGVYLAALVDWGFIRGLL